MTSLSGVTRNRGDPPAIIIIIQSALIKVGLSKNTVAVALYNTEETELSSSAKANALDRVSRPEGSKGDGVRIGEGGDLGDGHLAPSPAARGSGGAL